MYVAEFVFYIFVSKKIVFEFCSKIKNLINKCSGWTNYESSFRVAHVHYMSLTKDICLKSVSIVFEQLDNEPGFLLSKILMLNFKTPQK